MTSRAALLSFVLSPLLAVSGCGANESDLANGGTGGAAATGGTPVTGGVPATGGVLATGGALSTGGLAVTGGMVATGGLVVTGGVIATGGIDASGGLPTSGGSSSGGGATGGVTTGGWAGQGSADTGGVPGEGGTGGTVGFNPCPVSGDPCRILPFGDSITYGIGSTDDGGYRSRLFARVVAANQHVTFTGSQTLGPTQVSGVPFPRNHEGHSGWTIDPGYSSWGAGGISELVPSPAFDTNPDVVLLMIGTNDVNADSGQSTMTDRLEALLDDIVQTAPDALIVLATLTPLGWNPPALSDYNARLPAIVAARAAVGQHLVLVDMSQMPHGYLDSDHIHPNDQGYAYMADVWYSAIADYLPNQE